MDGHVDAHAQGVGAADDGQKALLRKLFDEQAVARQHAGVMEPDATGDEVLQGLAERRGEAPALDRLLDGLALLFTGDAVAGERAGRLQGGVLREVHDVERGVPLAKCQLHSALERGFDVLVRKRDGSRGVGDELEVAACCAVKGLADGGHVAQGRTHEQELRVGQREQGNLPGPAAVGVGEEMELVHGDATDVGVLSLAQRLVGKDLGSAADDGGTGVDMRIAGDHADVVAAQDIDQVEELLADEGLDGGGVVCTLTARHCHEHHTERDERFAGTGRRAEDDVATCSQGEQRVLLMRPEVDATCGNPVDEAFVGFF